MDKDAFQRRLAGLGSTLTPQALADFSSLDAKALRRAWEPTFDLLVDAFLHPGLPAGELEVQRQIQLRELRQEQEAPDAALAALARRTLFRGLPTSLGPQGTEDTVRALGVEQVRAHLSRLRSPARLLVVVVGDVDPAAVLERVRARLGALPAGEPPPDPAAPASFEEPTLTVEGRKLPTNYVLAAFPGPAPGSAAVAPALLAMEILGFRLFVEVRTKRNLSYAPSAFVSLAPARQPLAGLYVTAIDPGAALPVMQAEVRRLATEEVPDKELAGFRSTFLTRYLLRQEATDAQAQELAVSEILAGDWRIGPQLPERIRRVTAAEIRDWVRDQVRNYQVVALGDPRKIDLAMLR